MAGHLTYENRHHGRRFRNDGSPADGNTPKPMVPLTNRPMMHHIVNLLKAHGFTDLMSSLFYLPRRHHILFR